MLNLKASIIPSKRNIRVSNKTKYSLLSLFSTVLQEIINKIRPKKMKSIKTGKQINLLIFVDKIRKFKTTTTRELSNSLQSTKLMFIKLL